MFMSVLPKPVLGPKLLEQHLSNYHLNTSSTKIKTIFKKLKTTLNASTTLYYLATKLKSASYNNTCYFWYVIFGTI